jgi:hypothetical protein
LWRCLLIGLLSGLAAGVLVIPAASGLQRLTGARFPEELSPLHLAQAAMVSTLLGGVMFYAAARRSRRPVATFAVLAVGFAVVYSGFVAIEPPAPGFAVVVAPLHLLVAAVAIAGFALLGDRAYTTPPMSQRG